MKRVLLTGMSGTGKSTMVRQLVARGYKAVDLDEPRWSEAAPDGEWVWREERVRDLRDSIRMGRLTLWDESPGARSARCSSRRPPNTRSA